jgi:hypothetical protein
MNLKVNTAETSVWAFRRMLESDRQLTKHCVSPDTPPLCEEFLGRLLSIRLLDYKFHEQILALDP